MVCQPDSSPALDGDDQILVNVFTRFDAVSGLMTKEQIAEAQKLAREWKPTSTH
jgi:hypothetical protein